MHVIVITTLIEYVNMCKLRTICFDYCWLLVIFAVYKLSICVCVHVWLTFLCVCFLCNIYIIVCACFCLCVHECVCVCCVCVCMLVCIRVCVCMLVCVYGACVLSYCVSLFHAVSNVYSGFDLKLIATDLQMIIFSCSIFSLIFIELIHWIKLVDACMSVEGGRSLKLHKFCRSKQNPSPGI